MPSHEDRIEPQVTPDPSSGPAPPQPQAGEEPSAPSAAAPGAAPPGAAAYDPAAAVADVASDGVPELDPDELRERAAKADAYLALAQRTQADFENFRKRMTRDVRAAEARGVSRLAKELLPALDNLDRALAAVEASGEDEEHHLTQGIRLVQAELSAALARAGIEGYAPQGELFDPSQHEAVAQHPVEGTAPGTIVQVLQSGYRLNDAVLRPARVIVAG